MCITCYVFDHKIPRNPNKNICKHINMKSDVKATGNNIIGEQIPAANDD